MARSHSEPERNEEAPEPSMGKARPSAAAAQPAHIMSYDEARAISTAWHDRLAGRDLPDSAELIREDRER